MNVLSRFLFGGVRSLVNGALYQAFKRFGLRSVALLFLLPSVGCAYGTAGDSIVKMEGEGERVLFVGDSTVGWMARNPALLEMLEDAGIVAEFDCWNLRREFGKGCGTIKTLVENSRTRTWYGYDQIVVLSGAHDREFFGMPEWYPRKKFFEFFATVEPLVGESTRIRFRDTGDIVEHCSGGGAFCADSMHYDTEGYARLLFDELELGA